ncbi:MAG: Maf family protein [candidate division Zixibacteria bacterium]|nr:Maf family protein [candidate division Zixibacteria bacterium]
MTTDAIIALARDRRLVLGSRSPRRVQLLAELGIVFRQAISEIDETQHLGEDPSRYAVRLAENKALDVVRLCDPDEIVIGGDTVVILEGIILGKPANRDDAIETLLKLSGKRHTVCTALALANGTGLLCSGAEDTGVYFNRITSEQVERYVDTGEPMDKAGAYGIQGMGAFLVDRIEGNLDNVVGLPRALLGILAKEAHRLILHGTDC